MGPRNQHRPAIAARRAGVTAAIVVALMSVTGPAARSAATPPVNDAYLNSLVVTQASTTGEHASYQDIEDTTLATTQSDLFNPDPFGTVTSGGGAETTACNGTSYGNTIWYDIRPKLSGAVELQASGFGSAIAIYRYSPSSFRITRELGCRTTSSPANDYVYPFELSKGSLYTVQLGGLRTATGFQSGRLDFQLQWLSDRDADGTYDVLDKCPTLPGVDRYGGCPPTLHPLPRYGYVTAAAGGIVLSAVEIDQIPGGTVVRVRCRGCKLRQSATAGRHATSVKITRFSGRSLANGDRLEIYVTKRRSGHGQYRHGAIGSYISYTVRDSSLVDRVVRCLMPGSLTPRRTCPPGGERKHPASRPTRVAQTARRMSAR